MRKLLLALILTYPMLGHTFELKLSGSGEARYASGRSYECSEIFLDLDIKKDALHLYQGGYICGFLQAGFDSFEMDIRNGELWHEDQHLGHINDEEIRYQIYDQSDDSTYYFSLTKNQDSYTYFEEWHDGEKIALKVYGELQKIGQ